MFKINYKRIILEEGEFNCPACGMRAEYEILGKSTEVIIFNYIHFKLSVSRTVTCMICSRKILESEAFPARKIAS